MGVGTNTREKPNQRVETCNDSKTARSVAMSPCGKFPVQQIWFPSQDPWIPEMPRENKQTLSAPDETELFSLFLFVFSSERKTWRARGSTDESKRSDEGFLFPLEGDELKSGAAGMDEQRGGAAWVVGVVDCCAIGEEKLIGPRLLLGGRYANAHTTHTQTLPGQCKTTKLQCKTAARRPAVVTEGSACGTMHAARCTLTRKSQSILRGGQREGAQMRWARGVGGFAGCGDKLKVGLYEKAQRTYPCVRQDKARPDRKDSTQLLSNPDRV